MTLAGFITVPEQATIGGAPIDAFQADAFRQNDTLFEQVMQALLSSPFMPSGTDGDVVDPDAKQFVNARMIMVNTARNLTAGVPLIWMAREKITVNHIINARGMGAAAGQPGDFGGGGGGGTSAGQPCNMPFSPNPVPPDSVILAGSTAGAAGLNLTTADAWKLSRIPMFLPWLKGGAGGSDGGGAGGGVVCLCAPIIEVTGANGKIDARGSDVTSATVPAGTNSQGGGGGGLVLLIARQLINATPGTTVLVDGGKPLSTTGPGKAGGNGKFIPQVYQ
jgi:hypothetical protein